MLFAARDPRGPGRFVTTSDGVSLCRRRCIRSGSRASCTSNRHPDEVWRKRLLPDPRARPICGVDHRVVLADEQPAFALITAQRKHGPLAPHTGASERVTPGPTTRPAPGKPEHRFQSHTDTGQPGVRPIYSCYIASENLAATATPAPDGTRCPWVEQWTQSTPLWPCFSPIGETPGLRARSGQ